MTATWAICVVTLRRRRQFFARLMRGLAPQLTARVSLYTLEDEGAEKIGEKRQRMLEAAREPFVCFVDDDDVVSDDYVASILGALDEGPDVVGFRLRYYEDGRLRGLSITSLACREWSEDRPRPGDGLIVHYRTPNHLNPVRREIALAVGFKPMQTGEDADYSHRLFKMFPDMRERFVDKYLYDYLYRTPQRRAEGEHLVVPDHIAV